MNVGQDSTHGWGRHLAGLCARLDGEPAACRRLFRQPLRRRAAFLGLAAALFLAADARAQSTITTLAGTDYVFNGGGKPATDAPLGLVSAVILDRNGNPVIADPDNCIVFRINSDGSVTVLAGNGLKGFSGEGGPATSASLDSPVAVAFDASGNLYIADAGNVRIRKVTPSGTITTIAGNGIATSAGDGGAASSATFSYPVALAIDSSGAIYVSDIAEDPATSAYAARIRR